MVKELSLIDKLEDYFIGTHTKKGFEEVRDLYARHCTNREATERFESESTTREILSTAIKYSANFGSLFAVAASIVSQDPKGMFLAVPFEIPRYMVHMHAKEYLLSHIKQFEK